MPIEYAYPDRLNSTDHFLQMAVLIAVVVMFFLPLAREIFRPGAMNWWDVWLGGFCLIAAFCVPQAIETRALGRLRTELQLEPWMVAQIWGTNTWTSATALAYYTVLIHGGATIGSFALWISAVVQGFADVGRVLATRRILFSLVGASPSHLEFVDLSQSFQSGHAGRAQ